MPLPSTYISGVGTVPVPGLNKFVKGSAIVKDAWVDAAAIDDEDYSLEHAGAGAAGTVDAPLDGPRAVDGVGVADYPRNVVITVVHGSAVVAMSGTIYGYDRYGRAITEAWSVTAGTTSKVFTSTKAFARVTRVTETVAADASANTISIGMGEGFGLSAKCEVAVILAETEDGAVVADGVLVAGSDSTDALGLYTPDTALDGSVDHEIWYIATDR